MNSYDALLEAGHVRPEPCCVCTGEDAPACSEDCEAIVTAADHMKSRAERVDSLKRRIFLATVLIGRYRDEEPEGGPRELAAMRQVDEWTTELGCLLEES